MIDDKRRQELIQYVLTGRTDGDSGIVSYSSPSPPAPKAVPSQQLTERFSGDLYFCLESRTVCVCGREIDLTAKEFDIFSMLITNPNRVISYAMISETIWNTELDCYVQKTISNHVSRLRRKLQVGPCVPDYIKSIGVYLEIGGINTLNVSDSVIDQLAAIDKAESHFRSENIKFGIRHRMRNGKTMLNHTQFLGYTKRPDGILQIVPEEAEVVRKIFDLYTWQWSTQNQTVSGGIWNQNGNLFIVIGSPCLHPLNFGDVLYFSSICDIIFDKNRNKVERGIKR